MKQKEMTNEVDDTLGEYDSDMDEAPADDSDVDQGFGFRPKKMNSGRISAISVWTGICIYWTKSYEFQRHLAQ